MDRLIQISKKLINETDTRFLRYLYEDIGWNNRIIGIRGARGVGKTTLMLQHIKLAVPPDDVLYVNADDIYFSNHRLIDTAELLSNRGIHNFYIDEIHKYKDWSTEIKLIYDYYKDLKVVFSGSSILNLNKGASDLSRRAVMYQMYGLSFREYLALFRGIIVPMYSLPEILSGVPENIRIPNPLLFFDDYLKRGYYPFATDDGFENKMKQIINLTLENDIPVYANLSASMGRKLKALLVIIAQSVPFKPNMSKIAEIIGVGRNQLPEYFNYLKDAGMIEMLKDDTQGIRSLGKIEKVYLDNTNLIYSLAENTVNTGNLRETFFLNQTKVRNYVTSSKKSDFTIDGYTFEIGGKSKGKKQIENIENGYVVKDGIEYSAGNVIPLWWFGLNY